MKSKIKLSPAEAALEAAAWQPASPILKAKVEGILKAARQSRSITLRVSGFDLSRLREQAARDGIPYQTLLNSVLHRYVTGRLYDRQEVLKAVKLMEKRRSLAA